MLKIVKIEVMRWINKSVAWPVISEILILSLYNVLSRINIHHWMKKEADSIEKINIYYVK